MAGYTSTARQYGEYIKPYDIELLQKALSYKEGKYDANDAKIRAQIQQIGNLDILKDEDKAHLHERFTNALNSLNEAGSLDLSNSGITRSIEAHLSGVIDQNILNAVTSTREIRAFNESMNKMKEKGLWHSNNQNYAMRFVKNYMNDGKVGSKMSDYGSLVYTPWVDVQKAQMDYIKNLPKNDKGWIEVEGPDGKLYWKDPSALSESEIASLAKASLTGPMREQLKIDMWNKLGGNQDGAEEYYNQAVEGLAKAKEKQVDADILSINERLVSPGVSEKDKAVLLRRKAELEEAKRDLPKTLETWKKNKDLGLSQLGAEEYLTNTSAVLRVTKGDRGTFSTGKYTGVYIKETEWAFKRKELEIDQMRAETDRLRALNGGNGNGEGNGNGSGGKGGTGMPSVQDAPFTSPESLNPYDDLSNKVNSFQNEYNQGLFSLYNTVKNGIHNAKHDKQKEQLSNLMERYKQANGGSEEFDAVVWQRVAEETVLNPDAKGYELVDTMFGHEGEVTGSVSDLRMTREKLRMVEGYKKGIDDNSFVSRDKFINVFNDNHNRWFAPESGVGKTYFVDKDGNFKTIETWLKSKGINGSKLTKDNFDEKAFKELKEIMLNQNKYLNLKNLKGLPDFVQKALKGVIEQKGEGNVTIDDVDNAFVITRIHTGKDRMGGAYSSSFMNKLTDVSKRNAEATKYVDLVGDKEFTWRTKEGGFDEIKKLVLDSSFQGKMGNQAFRETLEDESKIESVTVRRNAKGEYTAKVKLSAGEGKAPDVRDVVVNQAALTRSNVMNKFFRDHEDYLFRNRGVNSKSRGGNISYYTENQDTVELTNILAEPLQNSRIINADNLKLMSNVMTIAGSMKEFEKAIHFDEKTKAPHPFYVDITSDTTKSANEKKALIKARQKQFRDNLNGLLTKLDEGQYYVEVVGAYGNSARIQVVDVNGNVEFSMLRENVPNFEFITSMIHNAPGPAASVLIYDILQREFIQKGTTGLFSREFEKIVGKVETL